MTISVSRDAKTLIIKNELIDNSGENVTWSSCSFVSAFLPN
jgi:hypothetical protein